MLLMAIQEANVKPTKQLWSSVAVSLGGGLTPSAVRCGHVIRIYATKFLPIVLSPILFFSVPCFYQLSFCFPSTLKGLSLTSSSQKYYKLKNESAKLAGSAASAPCTPLKPKTGRNKIVKSPASARMRKWKRAPEVTTAEVSEPEDEPVPSPNPRMKAITNVPFFKVHNEEVEFKREDLKVKDESDGDYIP